MYKKRRDGVIGIIITSIVLIMLVVLTNTNTGTFSGIENIFNKLIMPVQNGLTFLKNKKEGNNAFFENLDRIEAENNELKAENDKLKEQLQELSIVKAENITLREYADMSDKYVEYETVPAYVINHDVSNYSKMIVVNAGSADGVEPNMAVINGDGLVGHVVSVTEKTSKIQTIVDPASSVSATIKATRNIAVLKGNTGDDSTLKMILIPTDADLIIEDKIETSGLGGIYPKGIQIGKIKEVIETKNITDRYAIIETAVNFSKLDTVLVIKKYN